MAQTVTLTNATLISVEFLEVHFNKNIIEKQHICPNAFEIVLQGGDQFVYNSLRPSDAYMPL